MQNLNIVKRITYIGLLPFLFGLSAVYFKKPIGINILNAYAFMISSFIMGMQWGFVYNNPKNISKKVFIGNTVLTSLNLVFYLININYLIFSITLFIGILAIDKILLSYEVVKPNYYRFRRNITYIVSGIILLAILINN